ncbi:MAG: MYXO-CTERM sorting domain-containing protein [Polyangiaceae bacterium]
MRKLTVALLLASVACSPTDSNQPTQTSAPSATAGVVLEAARQRFEIRKRPLWRSLESLQDGDGRSPIRGGAIPLRRAGDAWAGSVAGNARLRIPVQANAAVALEAGAAKLSFRLEGLRAAQGALHDGVVVYENAAQGDGGYFLRPTAKGVEDFLVLSREPDGGPRVRYRVEIDGATLRAEGQRLVAVDATERELFAMSGAEIIDAQGELRPTVLDAQCSAQGCDVDVSWAPDLRYPALLDPKWTDVKDEISNATRWGHSAIAIDSKTPNEELVVVVGGNPEYTKGCGEESSLPDGGSVVGCGMATFGVDLAGTVAAGIMGTEPELTSRWGGSTRFGTGILSVVGLPPAGAPSTPYFIDFHPTLPQLTTVEAPELNTARWGFAIATLDQCAYVFGGYSTNFEQTYERLCQGEATWRSESLKNGTGRRFATATNVAPSSGDEAILLVGGTTGGLYPVLVRGGVSSVEPTVSGALLPSGCSGNTCSLFSHGATRLDSKRVLISGGAHLPVKASTSIEAKDLPPDPESTGVCQEVSSNETLVFDASAGTWKAGPQLKAPRHGHAAVRLANGYVLVVGGLNCSVVGATPAPVSSPWAEACHPDSPSCEPIVKQPNVRGVLPSATATHGGRHVVTLFGAPLANKAKLVGAVFSLLDDGLACSSDYECVSGHCADGVCCNKACDGVCEACNATGVCEDVPEGSDPDSDCEQGDSECGLSGLCDGAGACALTRQEGDACGAPASCASNVFLSAKCHQGVCQDISRACGVFACESTGCSSTECADGGYWDGNGCVPKAPIGQSCGQDGQCGSGHCVDGSCCDTACTGTCESCKQGICTLLTTEETPASCIGMCTGKDSKCVKRPAGAACDDDAECNGGCYQGMCCDSACRDDGEECQTAADCGGGACSDGRCATACEQSSDCPASLTCSPERLCVAGDDSGDDLSGCGCRTAGGPRGQSHWGFVALLALAFGVRRRAVRRALRAGRALPVGRALRAVRAAERTARRAGVRSLRVGTLSLLFVLASIGCGPKEAPAIAEVHLAASSMIAVPGTDLSIRAGHPRMWILPEDVEGLRCRAGIVGGPDCGASAALWQRMQKDIDEEVAKGSGTKTSLHIHRIALAHLLTGDTKYCAAVSTLLEAQADTGAMVREGQGPGRASTLAMAYDWCYDELSSSTRAKVGAYLLENAAGTPFNGAYPWFPGESAGLSYVFSVFGDGIDDAQAGELLAGHYRGFREVNLPATNQTYCDGGADGYAGVRADYMRSMTELFARSTSYTQAFEDSAFVANLGKFFIHRTRPDGYLSRAPGKNNLTDIDAVNFAAQNALRYGDEGAQWFAKQAYDQDDTSTDWLQLLWFDPTLPAKDPGDGAEGWQPVHEGTCSGMYFFRTDWSASAIHAGFFNGPDFVGHHTQNHFIIARGDDSLLIDSGNRSSDYDLSYDTYYKRSLAHNTIAILDPDEDFGDAPLAPGIHIPNDGGQIAGDEDEGCKRWPDACTPSGNAPGYRGEVVAHGVESGKYRYVMGDATPAYSAEKAKRVTRAFVELDPGIFVVYDRVEVTRPGLATSLFLHMIEQPALDDGSLEVLAGDLATGGVFESHDAAQVLVRYGDSALYAKTLLPRQAVHRIVGGGNADGAAVKQSDFPEYAFTHSTSASFEYENGGTNWTPESTQYPYGAAAHYGRNGSTSSTPPGSEAGDYRVEVRPASGEEGGEYLQVMQVGLGDPMTDDSGPEFSADSAFSATTYNAYGYGMYRGNTHAAHADGAASAQWTFAVADADEYELEVWLAKPNDRTLASMRYTLTQQTEKLGAVVAQADGNAAWRSLGRIQLAAGNATLTATAAETIADAYVLADAARLRRVEPTFDRLQASAVTSEDGAATGALIGADLLAIFGRSDEPLSDIVLQLEATQGLRVRVFGAKPSSEFSVAHDGKQLTIKAAAGGVATSTAAGVLAFSLDASCVADGKPCSGLGDDPPLDPGGAGGASAAEDDSRGCACRTRPGRSSGNAAALFALLVLVWRRRRLETRPRRS